MKLILALCLLSFSAPALAATYACDEQTSVIISGEKAAVQSPLFSAPELTILSDNSLVPGYMMASGKITSTIGDGAAFEGIIFLANGMLKGEAKGSIQLFTGEGFRTLTCQLQ